MFSFLKSLRSNPKTSEPPLTDDAKVGQIIAKCKGEEVPQLNKGEIGFNASFNEGMRTFRFQDPFDMTRATNEICLAGIALKASMQRPKNFPFS